MKHTREQLDRYFKKRGGYKTKLDREEFWDEDQLQKNVVAYIKEHYPNLKFFSDMSGAHLSKAQAVKFSSFRADDFKVPDMIFLGEGKPDLYLELKKMGVKIYTKSGNVVADKHIKAQANTLLYLRNKCGKIADFGVGYVDCVAKINSWIEKGEINYLLR